MNLEGPQITATAAAAAAAAAAAVTAAVGATTITTTITATSSSSLPSAALQGMRMSYAAAVQTGLGVKVMISPRLKKCNNKPGNKGQKANNNHHNNNNNHNNSKITADTKFRIFDEQPNKPHIVRVDPKVFRTDVEAMKATARLKTSKTKKPTTATGAASAATSTRIFTLKTSELTTSPKAEPEDADIKALELKFKRLACNAAGTAAVAANMMQTARNLNSIQGNSLTASNGSQGQNQSQGTAIKQHHQQQQHQHNDNNVKSPAFVDSISYLSFHQERLQRIVNNQSICVICLQSPETMKVPQFEDRHFKYLEEAALLAQNRTMLRLWLNADQLIC
ncbi:probable serine/threonine-protein kinase DDB_G0282963 [Drosophila hydei]|uniref:Probable serine/threonine-protein kinase DDB_G0282963 n=1 Tax=Drosophila hydei TaxID=7224 RepID=A0A6J2SXJ9_DROHY|nr:probable serine/threonine-protein kinase DDB_G0282963 [Drosophila hydei]XP_030080902.1 probable serine/threonine-protein kinase DDB_G0282963 [Drosophila hydei]